MENLYKVKEYSGELPNPKSFPIRGVNIIAIIDKPYGFCDGFILELLVSEKDKEKLERAVFRSISIPRIDGIIGRAEKAGILLSEPEYVYNTTHITYIVFTTNNEPIGIQVKYYKYFRNRYPKCQFYSSDGKRGIIGIKLDSELVAACMPVYLDDITIIKIKEERKWEIMHY